jgi:hypothetical protein
MIRLYKDIHTKNIFDICAGLYIPAADHEMP